MAINSRTPARFSSRQSVGCDGEAAIRGKGALGHLEDRIGAQPGGVVAVLVTGRDHLHAKADHVDETVDDLLRRARIMDAPRHALGHAKPLIHLGQGEDAAVRGPYAAVETGDHRLAPDG